VRAPALLCDLNQRLRGREIAGSRGGDEQIARAQRRRSHVAPDRELAAQVKESHGEATHLQSFAPNPKHHDTLRGDDGVDEPVERASGMAANTPARSLNAPFDNWARLSVIGVHSLLRIGRERLREVAASRSHFAHERNQARIRASTFSAPKPARASA
jgi:hypothetical protein